MKLFVISLLTFINSYAFNFDCSYDSKEDWINAKKQDLELKKANYRSAPSTTNALITNEYASLMYSQYRKTRLVGYFYSEASFHLGRITRYNEWPLFNDRRFPDRKKINGIALNTLLNTTPGFMSSKLMYYSEKLFYELYWSFHAYQCCGHDYTLSLIQDENLRAFYEEDDPDVAFKYFLTYEQTYLQNTLYRDVLIRPSIKAGIVDKMRWISFPGLDGSMNFEYWCRERNCGTSSFDLENRIRFDLYVLQNELNIIQSMGFIQRLEMSNSLEINAEFLKLKEK